MANSLTIGALSRSTGTKVETIRYYERIGLLPAPGRTEGNYRSYTADHLRRLGFIRRTRDLGFPLEIVRALLALADQPQGPCDDVDHLVAAQLAEVDRRIAELRDLRDELAQLAQICRGGRVSDCRILDALQPAETRPLGDARCRNVIHTGITCGSGRAGRRRSGGR